MQTQILVTDVNTIGAIAVVRSLGRAGYYVIGGSKNKDALGFHSKYINRKVIFPDPCISVRKFTDWLESYIQSEKIRVIIPSGDIIESLLPLYDKVASFIPFFCQKKENFLAGFKKYNLFQKIIKSNNITYTVLVDNINNVNYNEVKKLGFPLFIKCDSTVVNDSCYDGVTMGIESLSDFTAAIDKLSRIYEKAVIQKYVRGRGVGVFTFLHKGELLAKFMHFRDHEVPFTGGVSSLRSSYYNEAIFTEAYELLRNIEWEGTSMLEYRYDGTENKLYLMEMNARFWGSLHLGLCSGVDFPKLLVDNFLGKPARPFINYPLGVKSLVIEKEIQYIISVLKGDKNDLKERGLGKIRTVLDFFFMLFKRNLNYDLFALDDNKVGWMSLKRFLVLNIRDLFQKR